MNKANIIRTAFSTLAEAYLIEGRNKVKQLNREDSSTMNYRQSLRALFEAVIEEAAVRTPKKVRGALEKDERGIATQDGPEELVADIQKRHPADSPIGKKAGKLAYRYWQDRGEAAEKQRNQDAAHDAEWDEMDREHSAFFRGGRSRGLVK